MRFISDKALYVQNVLNYGDLIFEDVLENER